MNLHGGALGGRKLWPNLTNPEGSTRGKAVCIYACPPRECAKHTTREGTDLGSLFTMSLRRAAAALAILTTMVSASLVAMPATEASAASTPTRLIIDTDIYSNTDDEGALAVAFGLQLEGSANLLAIGVNTRTSRPQVATNSWKCAAAITQFYGFPDVPIGSDMPDNGVTVNSPDIVGPCAALASPSTPQPTAVVPLYRKTLAAQPDGSVVMVGIGYEENLAGLLASPPDSISPLSGSALVAQKVKELVLMGGGYPSRSGENNLIGNPTAAEAVASNWPTKVVYSGYEVGYGVFTGHSLSSVHPANSPIRVAYEALVGAGKNNRSFDVTALYHALQPADPLLSEVGPGTNAIDASGGNVFTPGAGDEYYLTLSNATALQNTLEGLMDVLPGTSPQSIAFTSTAPANATFGSTYAPSATGGASGDPVTFAIDTSSTSGCRYDASTGLVTFASPAGTCAIDADQGGSTVYAAAPRQSQIVPVGTGISQTVSFTSASPNQAHIGDTYAVGATSTSGLPVVISIDQSSTSGCTYSQGTGLVTFAGPAGTCTIDADQPGNATYAAAPTSRQTISVGLDAQSVAFTTLPPSSPKVGDTYAVAATSTSGLQVTISIDPTSTSACTYAQGTGLVTFAGSAGTCIVDADQAGNATFAAAQRVTQPIGVGLDAQTISFTTTPPNSAHVGDTYAVAATATSSLPVTISIDPSSTSGCTYAQDTGLVTFSAPAGTCVVDADQPGDATHAAAARNSQSVGVSLDTQSVAFTSSPPPSPKVGDTYAVGATATSGLLVTISIDPASTSGCTYAQGTGLITFAGPAGTCVVDADQPGTSVYAAAQRMQQDVTVQRAPQSIMFTSSPPTSPGPGQSFPVTASASSGLAVSLTVDALSGSSCSLSGNTLTILTSGPCEVDANQPGSSSYLQATQVQQLEAKGAQSVRFTTTAPTNARVFGTYAVASTASSGLAVTISIDGTSSAGCGYSPVSGLVTFTGPSGTCVLDANQGGSALYSAAPEVQQRVTVAKATQSLAFTTHPPIPARSGGRYAVTAKATSGLAVSLTIDRSSRGVCSSASGIVTFLKRGTCIIDANQPGNSDWAAATQIRQSITISS
jgi:hypothetical protein